MLDHPPVAGVSVDASELDRSAWPATVPAVVQLLEEGIDLAQGITLLVGENGSGKSTIVEALAMAYGLAPEGGTPHGGARTRESESPLHRALRLQRGIGAARWGFFLRAETMHGWFTFMDEHGGGRADPADWHAMSHGESFLAVLRSRFDGPGFYCLDEPEAALSFSAQLGLVGVLTDVVAQGGQVVCATHSPLVAAIPGATLLETGPWGLRRTTWGDLELVSHWRTYLADPQRYLRHVID